VEGPGSEGAALLVLFGLSLNCSAFFTLYWFSLQSAGGGFLGCFLWRSGCLRVRNGSRRTSYRKRRSWRSASVKVTAEMGEKDIS